jgi:hypothetical protein
MTITTIRRGCRTIEKQPLGGTKLKNGHFVAVNRKTDLDYGRFASDAPKAVSGDKLNEKTCVSITSRVTKKQ